MMNNTKSGGVGAAVEAVCATLTFLRQPGKCAWDREQTLTSLAPYLIEEAHETVEAIAKNDMSALVEELGDVLLQVVFQAMIAEADGHFCLRDVAVGLRQKLIRRHAHLLNEDGSAAPPGRKALSWEEIKAQERPKGADPLQGVPRSLPALLKASRMQEKRGLGVKLLESRRAIAANLSQKAALVAKMLLESESEDAEVHHLIGDLLFTVVSASRVRNVDAEQALTDAAARFATSFAPR